MCKIIPRAQLIFPKEVKKSSKHELMMEQLRKDSLNPTEGLQEHIKIVSFYRGLLSKHSENLILSSGFIRRRRSVSFKKGITKLYLFFI